MATSRWKFRVAGLGVVVGSAGLGHLAQSAPHPATAGSRMIVPQLGFFRSPHGFKIHSADSGWMQAPRPKDNSSIETVYRNTDPSAISSLTVRVDRLEKKVSLDSYVKRWKKDYTRFGFDILGIQHFQLAGRKAVAIDLINRDAQLQLRQVLTQSDDGLNVVLLTCRDKATAFKDALKACNSISKTLTW